MPNEYSSAAEALFGKDKKPTNPYGEAADKLVQQLDDERNAKNFANISYDPDQYAENSKLAREVNLPVDTVERNRDEVMRQKKVQEFNKYAKALDETPVLKDAFQQDGFARLAHDDLETLTGLEKAFLTVPDSGRTFSAEFVGLGASALRGFDDLIDAGFTKFEQGVDALAPGFQQTVDKARAERDANGEPFNPLDFTAGGIQAVSDFIDIPEDRKNFVTDVSGGLGQMAGQIAAVLANPYAGTAILFAQGADQQGLRADEAGATSQQRANAVLIGAGVTAITERVGIDAILNRVPPKIKNAVVRKFTDIGIAGGIEAVQEAVENVLQNLTARQFYEPDAEIFEGIKEQSTVAGATGSVARGIILAATPGKQAKTEHEKMEKGYGDALVLEGIVNQVRQSKLMKRDPEQLKGLLKRMAESHEDSRNVYVSAQAVQTLNQSGVPLEKLYQSIPDAEEQMNEALATGGDMVMTTEDWAKFLAENPEYEPLIKETRFSADALPATRLDEMKSMVEEIQQREAERAQQEDVEVVNSPEQQVFDDIYRQLTNTGMTPHAARYMAAVQESFWRTQADGMENTTALDLYRRQNLQVRREMPDGFRVKNLGFLLTPEEMGQIKQRVSVPAEQFVFEAVNIKRMLDTAKDPIDVNNRRQVEKLLDRPVDDALSILKSIGLSTGLKAGERETLKSKSADRRQKGKLVNYYTTEFVEALGETNTSLINQIMRDDGAEIDMVIESLYEGGFFPQYREMNDVPDEAAMDIIRRAASGELVLPDDAAQQVQEYLAPFDDMDRIVSDLQVDKSMSIEDIAERMAEIYAGEQDLESSFDQAVFGDDDTPVDQKKADELENLFSEFDELFASMTDEQRQANLEAADRIEAQNNAALENIRREEQRKADEIRTFRNRFKDRSSTAAWDADRVDDVIQLYAHRNGVEAKALVGFVDPVEFVLATAPIKRANIIADETPALDREKLKGESQTPFIIVEGGEIIGHEGRHRMIAMAKAGVRRAPVVVRDYDRGYTDFEGAKQVNTYGSQKYIEDGHSPVDLTISGMIALSYDNKQKVLEAMPQSPAVLYQSGVPEDSLAFQQWFKKSKVVDEDGKPLVVYHGTDADIQEFSLDTFGKNDTGFYGKGVYLSSNKQYASDFATWDKGTKRHKKKGSVYPLYASIQKPYVVDWTKDYENAADFVAQINKFGSEKVTDTLRSEGFDGIFVYGELDKNKRTLDEVVAFDPTQVKSVNNTGAFSLEDKRILFQSSVPEDSLAVLHNLSSRAVEHVDRIGGLPVPSLAVTKVVNDYDNFGEVTLVGDTKLIDPRLSAANQVFGADVYSPRYPSIQYQVDTERFNRFIRERVTPALEGIELRDVRNILNQIEDEGLGRVSDNEAVMYTYLKEQGKLPKIPYEERKRDLVDDNPKLKKYAGKDSYDLKKDPNFLKDIADAYRKNLEKKAKEVVAKDPELSYESQIKMLSGKFYEEDGSLNYNLMSHWADSMATYVEPSKARNVDGFELRNRMRKKLENDDQYGQWIEENFRPLIKDERIFDGFTPSGSRRYLPHNLDTVVRILKRGVRDSEGFNYGLGSVRSKFTPKFKSIQQVKDNRDLVVSHEQFEKLKEEADEKFLELGEKLREKYKFEAGFGYLDSYSEALKEVADKRNVRRVMAEYYDGLTDAELNEVSDFLDSLVTMPTQYFEAKIQRAVSLREFSGALVPRGKKYEKTVEILKNNGLEVRRYKEGDSTDRKRALMGFKKTFFQEDNLKSKRGSITFEETRTLIALGQNSDMSTFLHESAHLFVKALRDLARSEDGTPRQNKIYDDLSKWVGSEDGYFNVEQEEKVARAFEAYLREGNAPSLSLRDAFRVFQSWLMRIYKTMRGLNVEIDPEIRGIFDRMLATDAEIDTQAAAQEFTADPAIVEILTKAEREDYLRLNDEATKKAKERLLAKAIRQKEQEQRAEYQAERESIMAEVEKEVQSDPIQRAFKAITTGEDFAGNKVDVPKLNKQSLIDQFGDEVISQLPRGLQRVYSVKGGVTADELADLYGVKSGDEFIRRMLNLVKPKEFIEQRTDEILRDRYGDMLRDGTIEREARDEVYNDDRGQLIANELQYISRRTGQRNTPAEVAKQVAEDMIAKKKVPLAQQYARFVTSQVKAAREAGKYLAKKNYEKAATAKRQELLNHYLYMAGRDANQEVNVALRMFKRMEGPAAKKSIDPDYLEQIYELMERYDFRKSTSQLDISKRKSLRDFIQEREVAGDSISIEEIPERVRNEADRVSYKELSMSEFRALRDTVQQLAHLGRLKNKLVLGKERRDLQEVADSVAQSISVSKPAVKKKIGKRSKVADITNKYKLAMLNPTTILRELDSFQDLGPAFRNIKGVVDDAVSQKLIPMEHDIAKNVEELFGAYTLTERGQMASARIEVPELNDSLTKFQLISMGLNWGNQGNRDALVEGYGLSEQQVKAILDRNLTKRDWDFVQSVWDYVDSFWPQISALEKKRKGVAPEKVKPTKIATQFGEYSGGYYPLKFDADLDLRVGEETAEELMQHYRNGRFGRAQTRKGHTIERKGAGGRPVRLDMGVLSQHLKQVAYDISMHEAITYSDRVLHHPTVRKAFQDADANEYWRALDLWLKDTALGEIRQSDVVSSVFRHLRVGFTVSKLAWNVGTILVQPLGYTQTVSTIGARYALRGLRYVANAPLSSDKNAFGMVQELSPFMRKRIDTWNKDISETMRTTSELLINDRYGIEANARERVLRPIQSSGFYLIGRAQYVVDVATWMGAYHKMLDESGNEQDAIRYADDVVKRSQASGIFSDRSGFERGTLSNSLQQTELVRVWTTLASYMIAKANIAYEKTKRTDFKNPKNVLQWGLDMSMLFMLEAMILAAMRGTWPDEEEELPGWLAGQLAVQVAGTMPFVREFSSEAQGFRGGGGPFGALIQDSIGLGNQVMQGEFDAALVKKMVNTGGILFHLPASQPNRVIDAMFREADGEDVPLVEYFIWRDSD